MQHGRHQNRQLVPLRLALPRQPLGQLRLNPFRPNRDPVDLSHRSIPCRKLHGIVCITPSFSPSTYHRGKLMDGEEPWPHRVDGADLLSSITAAIERYMVMEPGAAACVA